MRISRLYKHNGLSCSVVRVNVKMHRSHVLISSVLFCFFISFAECARILGVFQMPSISHQRVFQPLWKELSLRGHEVIVVTPSPLNDPTLVNLTEIDVSPTCDKIWKRRGFQFFMRKEIPVYKRVQSVFELNYELAESMFQYEEFIKVYNDTEKPIDLIIAQTYVSPIFYSLSAKLNAPIIGISSLGVWVGSYFGMGSPHPPALYSEMYLPAHGKLTFIQRFYSTIYYLWTKYYYNYVALPKCDQIARKYLGNDLPYLGDVSLSLLFVSTNLILYPPRPTVPGIINIEHMHVKPPRPLPKDIKKILDDAKKGVVYFSLGSNVQSVNTTQKFRNTIIEAFAELPYTVLWKFESEGTIDTPKNVITNKWLPQQDILAHPNLKVFVTQCGLQSIEEAVSRGVPMVGIPYIAEQAQNIKRMEEFQMAVGLEHNTLTKDELKNAIIEVAENEKYKKNVEKMREMWLDHPQTSLERAVWWTEYVIRHKGAKHLRSPYLDISWSEYLLLDVISVLLLALAIIVYITYKFVKIFVEKCFRVTDKYKQS